MLRLTGPLFTLVLFLSACAADPNARGRSRFVGLGCATCHRVGSQGGGQAGPDLTTVGRRHSAEWLDVWMRDPQAWKPDTTMPGLKLPNDVRAEVVAYMASLLGDPYRSNPPWDSRRVKGDPIKRGEVIYNRVGCVACHGPRGQGGYPNNNVVGGQIPSLTFARDGFTREELQERIKVGRRPEPADPAQPAPLVTMPGWGDYLREDEINDLITYIFSLRPAVGAGEEWDQ